MAKKEIHPARKVFRRILLGLMGLSIAFLLFVVALRVHYRDGNIEGPMQTAIFQADVIQHKARTIVGDDAQDMQIIERLFALGFFSPVYTEAGYEMLSDKAESGYEPAAVRLAEIDAIILERKIIFDRITKSREPSEDSRSAQ